MAEATPTSGWIERSVEDDNDVLYLTGVWRLPNVPAIAARLGELGLREGTPIVLDGSRLETLDTAAGFILLRHLAGAGLTRETVSGRGFDPRYERLLLLVYERMSTPPAAGHTVHLGLVQGGLGGMAALAIVYVCMLILNRSILELARLYGSDFRLSFFALPDCLALLAFAAVLGWLGAYMSVSRHLSGIEPS